MRRVTMLMGAVALGVAASCGGGGGYGSNNSAPTSPSAPTGGSTSNAISVRDDSFSPASTTVAAGTTVTWSWDGANRHNVTFDDGLASATQASGTYSRTFSTAGTYNYHCTIHGAAMSGVVTVK